MVSSRRSKTPAQRQRELRSRRRNDEMLLRIKLPREHVRDFLLDEAEIGEWDAEDDAALQEGLQRLMLRMFRDVTA